MPGQKGGKKMEEDKPIRPEEVKKRGRKASAKKDEDKEKSVPKKRGRRPKDKTYTVISNYKEVSPEVEDDNVILHLPSENGENVPQIENDIMINTEGLMKYDPNLNEPMPYEPLNSMQSGFAVISDKLQEKIEELEETKVELEMETEENIVENMEKKDDEVFMRKIGFEEINNNYFNVLKKAEIMKLIESEESKKEWSMTSDVSCFYCTEKFDSVPIGIPTRYVRGKFVCRDNFCSFNCAAAYIFAGMDMRYHFKKWEYYSLLCLMAGQIDSKINKEKGEDNNKVLRIKMAEDRNLLKKFGGPLSIEKFREQFYVLDSKHSMLYPPLTCMYPQTEVAHYVRVHRQKALMLNRENRTGMSEISDLRLKRGKPLIQKKNTLEEYMSLRIN
jgi:hypothetical protein